MDDIPNEFLKYGGEPMIFMPWLTCLFISAIRRPSQKRHSKTWISSTDNYTEGHNFTTVYKLYTMIIENVIMAYIEEISVLHETKGAFGKTKRLEDNIIYINGLCSTRKNAFLYVLSRL